jgi:hypothetical protein
MGLQFLYEKFILQFSEMRFLMSLCEFKQKMESFRKKVFFSAYFHCVQVPHLRQFLIDQKFQILVNSKINFSYNVTAYCTTSSPPANWFGLFLHSYSSFGLQHRMFFLPALYTPLYNYQAAAWPQRAFVEH